MFLFCISLSGSLDALLPQVRQSLIRWKALCNARSAAGAVRHEYMNHCNDQVEKHLASRGPVDGAVIAPHKRFFSM
ncbi:hypothetical protein B0H16DRAFT_664414 [Mycena metata]|uniref:Uncharacterized protein n=1 Tax=Mycena metata TaxID=1033252 RepID=A0AAD7NF98_9AGAR|nr:hypothetical protein B0H16DRAFT_664414 [Mycena metata]